MVFLVFGFGSLLIVQIGAVLLLSANEHLTQKQLQQMIESKPQFLVGTNVLWYALLFLFLYMTLAVLRGLPFWRSLGWKKLGADPAMGKGSPWMYFFCGCGLAIFVAIASSGVKNVDHLPIQELFKSRSGAVLKLFSAVIFIRSLPANFPASPKTPAPTRFAPSASVAWSEFSSPESCSASCTARNWAGPGAWSAS